MKKRTVSIILLAIFILTPVLSAISTPVRAEPTALLADMDMTGYEDTQLGQNITVSFPDMLRIKSMNVNTTSSTVTPSAAGAIMNDGSDLFLRMRYMEGADSTKYMVMHAVYDNAIPAQKLRFEITYRFSPNLEPTYTKLFFLRVSNANSFHDETIVSVTDYNAGKTNYQSWQTAVINYTVPGDSSYFRLIGYISPGSYIDVKSFKVYGEPSASGKTQVVCMGDSITAGVGVDTSYRSDFSYPGLLQNLLGDEYEVINCGRSSSTTLPQTSPYMNPSKNAIPYASTSKYTTASSSSPDIVLLMLGTNDSKTVNTNDPDSVNEFYYSLKRFAVEMMRKPSSPKVYILTSPYRYDNAASSKNLQEAIVPTQKRLAEDLGIEIIDLNAITKAEYDNGNTSIYDDKLHFNEYGYAIFAQNIYDAITEGTPVGTEYTDTRSLQEYCMLTAHEGDLVGDVNLDGKVDSDDLAALARYIGAVTPGIHIHTVADHAGQAKTCTAKGHYGYQTCSECGATSYEEFDAAGHVPGDVWTEDIAATADAPGLKHRTCTVCGRKTDLTVIDKTPAS